MIREAPIAAIKDRLVILYKQMSEMTNPLCGKCVVPNSCCDNEIACQMAADRMKQWNELYPETGHRFRYMGPNGCIVPPHLRPLCTIHVCEKHLYDEKTSDAYWGLRNEIDELEWELSETPLGLKG